MRRWSARHASLATVLGALPLVACSGADGTVARRTAREAIADAGASAPDAALTRSDAYFEPVDASTVCARVEVAARRITPDVTVIVDQSGSMSGDFSGGLSRWQAVRRVLTGPDGLVTTTDGFVRYGVALFSDTRGGSAECPIVTQVPVAISNHDAIETLLASSEPLGETPTGHAIESILEGVEADPDPGMNPRIFVLATDGNPDRCGAPDGHDATSKMLSVRAVEHAYALGIRTFVIGVGEGTVATEHLEALAAAGQGGVASPYYEAANVAELADALRTIVRGEISCTMELEGRIDPTRACDGEVLMNSIPLTCDDPDGWHAVDETHIELTGSSCDALVEREGVTVDATFPCDVVLI